MGFASAHNVIGKNWPIPPATINPPTARFTRRLCKEASGQRLFRRGDVIAHAWARPNHILRKAWDVQYV